MPTETQHHVEVPVLTAENIAASKHDNPTPEALASSPCHDAGCKSVPHVDDLCAGCRVPIFGMRVCSTSPPTLSVSEDNHTTLRSTCDGSRRRVATMDGSITKEMGNVVRGKRSAPSQKRSHHHYHHLPHQHDRTRPQSQVGCSVLSELTAAVTAMVAELTAVQQLVNGRHRGTFIAEDGGDPTAATQLAQLADRINGHTMLLSNRLVTANHEVMLHLQLLTTAAGLSMPPSATGYASDRSVDAAEVAVTPSGHSVGSVWRRPTPDAHYDANSHTMRVAESGGLHRRQCGSDGGSAMSPIAARCSVDMWHMAVDVQPASNESLDEGLASSSADECPDPTLSFQVDDEEEYYDCEYE